MGNSRKFVVRLLTKLDENSSYSNIALDEALKRSDLSPQDKKFASALFYGTLERRLTLDEIIRELSSDPRNKLNHTLRNILRTGLYQLKYMDSVPDNAAVDEAVKLAKKLRNPLSPGFVNGLLREFIRRDKKLPEKDTETGNISVEYSCPEWLVEKWVRELGKQKCKDMLLYTFGRPPETVKLNYLKGDAANIKDKLLENGVTFERAGVYEDALNIAFSGAIESTGCFRDGLFHVQDLSSQICCHVLDPQKGETVLDLCSAPGGKAFTIAELMGNEGKVIAADLHENRVRLIRSGAERLGLSCIEAIANDAKVFNESLPAADRVLCDVPCSGLGVIRRKPEIKYKDPADFDRLPDIQYKILDTSSGYVKPGGVLVYSTCTVSEQENGEVVEKFLSAHLEFEPSDISAYLKLEKPAYKYTILPDRFGSDGFFIARLVRRR